MMKSLLRTIGTDVETFVTKDGEIHPLKPGEIKGTKKKPFQISPTYNVGIQLDNVLAEITFAPADSGKLFENMCDAAQITAWNYLHSLGFAPEYRSSHIFEPEQLEYPHAKAAGCEPDFPSVEGEGVPVFNATIFQRLRTGSGHLHFGLAEPQSKSNIIQLVRGLDRAIGAQLVLEHSDPLRRKLYGQAGRFRYKDYGFEYRTPDNYWFSKSHCFASAIWDAASEVLSIPMTDPVWSKVNDQHVEMARSINLGLVPQIESMLNDFDFPRVTE